jgi:glycosyltransferase involved in cell wall biosynthesis
MVVSPRDLEALGATRGLALVPNAVDLEAFPCSRHDREPATVVFTGNMGYFPNVTAAVWFAKEAFPLIRQAVPEARFVVVGARPVRSVRALAADPAVTVTGRVDDVGPFLRRATVAVAPMRTGSGQQIKILEAMASGVPVVATPAEADQVGATHDQELLVASGARAFADAVIALFRDEARADRLARNARRLVETRFTWEHSMAALAGVYEAALEGRGKAASAAPRAS